MLASRSPNLLQGIALFEGIAPSRLARLGESAALKAVPAGGGLLQEGHPGEVVFFIHSGAVKVTRHLNGGAMIILDILGPGDVLGEMSLLGLTERTANAVALEPTTLVWIGRADFDSLLNGLPVVAHNLMHVLSERLSQANQRLLDLATLDVNGRVARSLLNLGERFGKINPAGEVVIPIRLSQSDWAGLAVASRERVNHSLVSMRRDGIIAVDDGYIMRLRDRQRLIEMCSF
jgi:CRP-like cAMP-binding protein